MPCAVCNAHPTWADLSECNSPDCPWAVKNWVGGAAPAIPPLTAVHMNPPSTPAVQAPVQVGGPPPVGQVAAAHIGVEQPHAFETTCVGLMAGMAGGDDGGPSSAGPAPGGMSWAGMAKLNKAKPAPIAPKKPVVAKKSKTPVAEEWPDAPAHLSAEEAADFETVIEAVNKMNWYGSHGPTVWLKTRLDWKYKSCRRLYLAVKRALHKKGMPGWGDGNTFYVGALRPPGKAGFRISRHRKNDMQGHGILHFDNS